MSLRLRPAGKVALRELVLYGLLGAILVAAQLALAVLANVELVSLLIIVYTLALGKRALFPVYVFVLLEGLIFGFGLWFINYLYVWALLVGAVLLLRPHMQGRLGWTILSASYGLLFGALCAIPYFFIGGPSMAFAYWLSGIPYDLAHCAGNCFFALVLVAPLERVMLRCAAGLGKNMPEAANRN
ncbi:MAG: hypothetical protein RSG50_10810 [Clostridia bacterium]